MKLWILSDLHFEFHDDKGAAFLRQLPDVDHDVAILAGDICGWAMLGDSLRLVSERFKRAVFILGNHEPYGLTIEKTIERASQVVAKLPNVHFLERETVTIDGVRIHGATLWFPYEYHSHYEAQMNDFWQIGHIRKTVNDHNREAVKFLEREVRPGDVVVTHHLPSSACVDGKYADSPLNQFFVGCAAHVAKDNAPALWVHGHTHTSLDFYLERTRVVCNPYGYAPHDVNPQFDFGKVIEVVGAA